MNKNLCVIIAAFALSVPATASGQTIRLNATVPFDFVVGESVLPAGEYSIQTLDNAGKVVAIRSSSSTGRALVLSNACRSLAASPRTKLVFHRFGDDYFLAQIWVEGNDAGREIPASRREKQLAKDFSAQGAVVAARQ